MTIAAAIGKRLFAITPQQGAETSIYLASSPEVERRSGLYFIKSAPATPSEAAQDDAAAERLWQESARISGLNV